MVSETWQSSKRAYWPKLSIAAICLHCCYDNTSRNSKCFYIFTSYPNMKKLSKVILIISIFLLTLSSSTLKTSTIGYQNNLAKYFYVRCKFIFIIVNLVLIGGKLRDPESGTSRIRNRGNQLTGLNFRNSKIYHIL